MEMMVKKYQQKFRKIKDEMGKWDELQSRFLSHFRNASSIIQRLPVYLCLLHSFFLSFSNNLLLFLVHRLCFSVEASAYMPSDTSLIKVLSDKKNYGELAGVGGIKEVLLGKQMESLGSIFCSMRETLKEFYGIVVSLEKILRDGNQLLKGGSMQPTANQMKLRVGIKPSLEDCLDGLKSLHEMHLSEYLLKTSIIEALTLNSSANDLGALYQLLVDQPNISNEEVQFIYNIIFPEEIC